MAFTVGHIDTRIVFVFSLLNENWIWNQNNIFQEIGRSYFPF